jgi:hypothetical protein
MAEHGIAGVSLPGFGELLSADEEGMDWKRIQF